MNQRIPLTVAGIIFAIVTLVHLSRIILKFNLIIASYTVPIWVNGVGFVIGLVLCLWMFAASRRA